MIHLAVYYLAMAACMFVLVACVCRVDQLRSTRNRWDWFLLYVLIAAYALSTLIGFLRSHSFTWEDVAGIAAFVLYMCLTRRLWANGAPPETVRGALQNADGTPVP